MLYQKPKKVDEEDRDKILKLASQGFMDSGFHEKPNKIYEIATTTDMGNELSNLASISRDPKTLKFFKLLERVAQFI